MLAAARVALIEDKAIRLEFESLGPINAWDYGARPAGHPQAGPIANSNAIDLALQDAWWGPSNVFGRPLYFPTCRYGGRYEIARTFSIAGRQGFTLMGDGPMATMLMWRGPGGGLVPMFQMSGCAHVTIKDICFWSDSLANGGSKPSAAILSLAEGGGTSWNHRFERVVIDGAGSSDLFTNGIVYTTLTGAGNNSEVTYDGVRISKCTESCWQISGTQAKTHKMESSSGTTSKYVVRCKNDGFGSTTVNWKGGTASNISECVFSFDNPGEPCAIEDIVCEQPHRFLEMAFSTDAGQPLLIKGCRVDATVNKDIAATDSMILLGTAGPTEIEGCTFHAGDKPVQLKLINQGVVSSHSLDGNFFLSDNSFLTSPINWASANTGPSSMVRMGKKRPNVFIMGANGVQRVPRMEGIDWVIPETDDFALINGSGADNMYPLRVGLAGFKAAAQSQSRCFTLPRGTCVLGAFLHQNGRLHLPDGSHILFRLGSTPGGDEYIHDTDVSLANSAFLADPSKYGPNLTTLAIPGIGYCPAYMANTFTVYVTLTSSGQNLGDGTVTYLNGDLDMTLKLEKAPRWLQQW